MKRILVLVILLAITATSLSALNFVVGPKIAVADYNWRGDGGPGGDNMLSLSYELGGFANLQFSSMIGLQIEAMYKYQTFRFESGGSWYQYRTNALSLPVYARFDFDMGGLGIYALAGVQFDLLFGALAGKTENTDWINVSDNISDFFDNTLLISIAGGAGVSIPAGPGILDVGAGITYSLTSCFEYSDMWPWGIDIQVAYGFAL